jgi:hypothetical protein
VIRNTFQFVGISIIEVAYTPGQYLSVAHELLECGNGFLERMPAVPVERIAIEAFGRETSERLFAGCNGAATRRILRDLGNQKDLVASSFDGLRNRFFSASGEVHLRGIDLHHAEVDSPPQRCDGRMAIVRIVAPRTLPDNGNAALCATETSNLHMSNDPICNCSAAPSSADTLSSRDNVLQPRLPGVGYPCPTIDGNGKALMGAYSRWSASKSSICGAEPPAGSGSALKGPLCLTPIHFRTGCPVRFWFP